jgi:hypothetical protein
MVGIPGIEIPFELGFKSMEKGGVLKAVPTAGKDKV